MGNWIPKQLYWTISIFQGNAGNTDFWSLHELLFQIAAWNLFGTLAHMKIESRWPTVRGRIIVDAWIVFNPEKFKEPINISESLIPWRYNFISP